MSDNVGDIPIPVYTMVRASVSATPVHANVHNHHVTIHFRPDADAHHATPYGAAATFRVTGRVVTPTVDAFIVTFTDGPIDDDYIRSGVPHITISTADGVSPAASIAAIRDAVANGTVRPAVASVVTGTVESFPAGIR